ncbi:protein mono-ADP-ribosyltransferase PARP14-like [Littorina saxatilis]|uniref:protein mono-ADP-ribosyltransferase PARP14-like n=1 Tax=Littorina saxatilis TaxID=31220 RepID=UPI0038B4CE7D
MRNKGFVMTSAPRPLHCKSILHVDLGRYVDKPKDTIKECVKQVQEKKMASVAFPALGTGESTNNGPEELAKHMVDAIKEIKDPKKLEEVRIVMSSRRLFVRLVAKVDALVAPAGNPSGKSKPEEDKQQAAAASAKSADRSAMSRPPQTSPPPSLPPQEWESVCHRGHSLDPTRQDAVSLFIFSDSEERRQAAVEEIATGIVSILGPVETEEPRKKVAGDGGRRGDDGQGDHSGGSFYSWEWGVGHYMPFW